METKTRLTWRQLDEMTGYMLQDMDYYGFQELINDEQLDEPIWDCLWIDSIIECLNMEYEDMPSNYDAEMYENRLHVKLIKEAIK